MKCATPRECTPCPGVKAAEHRRLERRCCEEETVRSVRSHSTSPSYIRMQGEWCRISLPRRGMEVSLTQMRTGLADSQHAVFPERFPPPKKRQRATQARPDFPYWYFSGRYCRIHAGAPISIFGADKLIRLSLVFINLQTTAGPPCVSPWLTKGYAVGSMHSGRDNLNDYFALTAMWRCN